MFAVLRGRCGQNVGPFGIGAIDEQMGAFWQLPSQALRGEKAAQDVGQAPRRSAGKSEIQAGSLAAVAGCRRTALRVIVAGIPVSCTGEGVRRPGRAQGCGHLLSAPLRRFALCSTAAILARRKVPLLPVPAHHGPER